jgi:hypothetical protein
MICTILDEFFWTDNFNGVGQNGVIDPLSGTGGVDNIGGIDSAILVDPSTGTGGITILNENGESVPGPSSLTLFATASLFVVLRRKRRQR